MKRSLSVAILALSLLGTAGGYAGWRVRSHAAPARPATSSAPGARKGPLVHAEGRMVAYPGAEVTLSTEVGGTLARIAVEERAVVKKGDVLIELDATEQRAALAEARARASEAFTDARLASREAARSRSLLASGAIAQAAAEHSSNDGMAAGARGAAAQATVRRLEAALAKTRIAAPIDGTVIAREAQPGETVPPGARLLTIADLSRVRLEVEVDEFDVGSILLGAEVTVSAEGYRGQTWRGRIEEIPDIVGPRRLKPQDPSRPTDTRVLLVKVSLDEHTPLKLGQRVDAEISTEAPVSEAAAVR